MKKISQTDLILLEKKLSEYQGEDKIISSHELFEELKKTNNSVFQVKTGIPSLDRILDKTEMGELIILTGPTGEGKTSLASTITKNISSDHKSVWFTLEVTPRQFIQKIMAGEKDVSKLPLFYMPAKNLENTIDWIESKIIEAKVKHNVQVVFIDHIHQIFSLERMKHNNISLEIGDMVAKIKDMAITHNLVIYLIAHTKDDPTGSTREPQKESIRDSGFISRLADSIIAIWRVPSGDAQEILKSPTRRSIGENDSWAKVRILKNRRNGKLGTFLVDHKNHYLFELDQTARVLSEEEQETDYELNEYGKNS